LHSEKVDTNKAKLIAATGVLRGPNFAATARDLLACLATETYVENVHLELTGFVRGDAQALLLRRKDMILLHRRH
jgi:hypothetical protein